MQRNHQTKRARGRPSTRSRSTRHHSIGDEEEEPEEENLAHDAKPDQPRNGAPFPVSLPLCYPSLLAPQFSPFFELGIGSSGGVLFGRAAKNDKARPSARAVSERHSSALTPKPLEELAILIPHSGKLFMRTPVNEVPNRKTSIEVERQLFNLRRFHSELYIPREVLAPLLQESLALEKLRTEKGTDLTGLTPYGNILFCTPATSRHPPLVFFPSGSLSDAINVCALPQNRSGLENLREALSSASKDSNIHSMKIAGPILQIEVSPLDKPERFLAVRSVNRCSILRLVVLSEKEHAKGKEKDDGLAPIRFRFEWIDCLEFDSPLADVAISGWAWDVVMVTEEGGVYLWEYTRRQAGTRTLRTPGSDATLVDAVAGAAVATAEAVGAQGEVPPPLLLPTDADTPAAPPLENAKREASDESSESSESSDSDESEDSNDNDEDSNEEGEALRPRHEAERLQEPMAWLPEPKVSDPKFNRYYCAFGAHPRSILLARRDALTVLDFQGSEAQERDLPLPFKNSEGEGNRNNDELVCALARHPTNRFQLLMATNVALYLLDERHTEYPLLTWRHNQSHDPPHQVLVLPYNAEISLIITCNQSHGEVTLYQYCQPVAAASDPRSTTPYNPTIVDVLRFPPEYPSPYALGLEHSLPSLLRLKQYQRWERSSLQSGLLSNLSPLSEAPILGLAFCYLINEEDDEADDEGDADNDNSQKYLSTPLPLKPSKRGGDGGSNAVARRSWVLLQMNEAGDIYFQPFAMATSLSTPISAPLFQPSPLLASPPPSSLASLSTFGTTSAPFSSLRATRATPSGGEATPDHLTHDKLRGFKLADLSKVFAFLAEGDGGEQQQESSEGRTIKEVERRLDSMRSEISAFISDAPRTLKEIHHFLSNGKGAIKSLNLLTLRRFLKKMVEEEKNKEQESGQQQRIRTHRIQDRGSRTRKQNTMERNRTTSTTTKAKEDEEPQVYYAWPLGLIKDMRDYNNTVAQEEGEGEQDDRGGTPSNSQQDLYSFATPMTGSIPFSLPLQLPREGQATPLSLSSTPFFGSQSQSTPFDFGFNIPATPAPTTTTTSTNQQAETAFRRPPYLEGIKRLAPMWAEREAAFFGKSRPMKIDRRRETLLPRIRIKSIIDDDDNEALGGPDEDTGVVMAKRSSLDWDLNQGVGGGVKRKRPSSSSSSSARLPEGGSPSPFKKPRRPASVVAPRSDSHHQQPIFLTPLVPPRSASNSYSAETTPHTEGSTPTTLLSVPSTPSSTFLTPPTIVARSSQVVKKPPKRRQRLGF